MLNYEYSQVMNDLRTIQVKDRIILFLCTTVFSFLFIVRNAVFFYRDSAEIKIKKSKVWHVEKKRGRKATMKCDVLQM